MSNKLGKQTPAQPDQGLVNGGTTPGARQFTTKQQRLIDCYAGDIKKAAKESGLSYGYARRLVTKGHIFEAIKTRQDTEIRPTNIANRQARQVFWTRLMRDKHQEVKDRLRASELLGRSEMDFVEKRIVKIEPKTLADAAALYAARKARN